MRGPDGPHPARAWVDFLVHVDLALTEYVVRSNSKVILDGIYERTS